MEQSTSTPDYSDRERWCTGKLSIFIAEDSSVQCHECGFIGWVRMDVEPSTGRILRYYPHPRRVNR